MVLLLSIPPLLLAQFFFLLQFSLVRSFASSSPKNVVQSSSLSRRNQRVSIVVVRTNDDIQSLADLRYHEWIINEGDGDDMTSHHGDRRNHHPVPSISSFRLATWDIFHERTMAGATTFLAMSTNDGNAGVDASSNSSYRPIAVGSAELSPIEMDGVFENKHDNDGDDDICCRSNSTQPMYITDVVISSAFRHRGIGSSLMQFLENYAWTMKGTRELYLHVAEDNVGARKFYERLGYRDVMIMIQNENRNVRGVSINYDRLAANAGTVGQTLMMKRLLRPNKDNHDVDRFSAIALQPTTEKSTTSGSGGFARPKIERRRNR